MRIEIPKYILAYSIKPNISKTCNTKLTKVEKANYNIYYNTLLKLKV